MPLPASGACVGWLFGGMLAPVIDKLAEDHGLIVDILRRVGELTARADGGADPAVVVGELDGLVAIMDSHFAFEERRITAAIDALAERHPEQRESLSDICRAGG